MRVEISSLGAGGGPRPRRRPEGPTATQAARRALLQRFRPDADERIEQLGPGLHLGVPKAHGACPNPKPKQRAEGARGLP